jgi:predicted DNA-binding transcriptional regulator AlpA
MDETTKWLPTTALVQRFGKTTRTVINWENTRPNGFPLPVRVNGRKYWRETDIIEWERELIASKTEGAK